MPPVGKSGPGIISINFSILIFGSLIWAIIAFANSLKLCGGIFVDIPTAIPEAPFSKRLGIFEGKTLGSFEDPS